MSKLKPTERMRLERDVAYLHRLGERPTGELLEVLALHFGDVEFVRDAIHDYRAFSREWFVAVGADRFPARKLRVVS